MSTSDAIVILSARRTPIGGFLGALSSLPAPSLGAAAIRAAVHDSGVKPEQIDEVYNGTKVPTMGEGEGELHQLKTEG